MASKRICSVEGCGKPQKHRGWCAAHYSRWYDHGDPLGGGPARERGRKCSVNDCDAPHYIKGYCIAHHYRWKTYGDPLFLKKRLAPRGEPMKFLMEVVLPFQGDECLKWPYSPGGTGYGEVCFNGKRRIVPRLICELVYGPPPTPKHQAAHSCGKGHEACCNPKHLQWKTRLQNEADKILHGTTLRGERSPRASITEDLARKILSLKGNLLQRQIADEFGVPISIVKSIHARMSWRHI